MEIIQRYSKPDATSEDFIFPILDRKIHRTEMQRKNRIHKVIGKVNPRLAEIGKMAGLETHLTTYSARHSFASILQRHGVDVSYISECLGHSSISVTESYLAGFGRDDREKNAVFLMDFECEGNKADAIYSTMEQKPLKS